MSEEEQKKKKRKKKKQIVVLETEQVESELSELVEVLEELEKEKKYVDVQICPHCKSAKVRRESRCRAMCWVIWGLFRQSMSARNVGGEEIWLLKLLTSLQP